MILSAAIMLSILLPIFISLLLSLHTVQNKIVKFASEFASEFLSTEVSVGRIDVTTRGRVEVKDFLVRDLDRDTLLYVNHLDTRLLGYLPVARNLLIGESHAVGVKLNIRQTSRGVMNIKEITDKLSSKSGGRMKISVSSVDVEGGDMLIEQLDHKNPEYGVDLRFINLHQIKALIEDLMIDGSAIHAQLCSLSMREQSGIELRDASGEIYVTQGALSILDMKIATQWSSLTIPELLMVGRNWSVYKDFNRAAYISLNVSDGYLSSDDVAYFAPSLRKYAVELHDLSFKAEGEVNNLKLELANASYGEGTYISANANIKGLPEVEKSSCRVQIDGISTTANDLGVLYESIKAGDTSNEVHRIIEDLGRVELSGEISADRGGEQLTVDVDLSSDLGEVMSDITITRNGKELTLDGEVESKALRVGRIARTKKIGLLTSKSTIKGDLGDAKSFTLNSFVSSIGLNGYPLRNTSITAKIDNTTINSEVKCRDRNLKFDFKGAFTNDDIWQNRGYHEFQPSYHMSLDLTHANLVALGVNHRDSSSLLSAQIIAQVNGESVESGALEAEILSGKYSFNGREISLTEGATLQVRSQDLDRYMELQSEFFDAEFESASQVSEIVKYLQGSLASYLPALYEDRNRSLSLQKEASEAKVTLQEIAQREDEGQQGQYSEAERLSKLRVKSNNLEPIAQIFIPDLEVDSNTLLSLDFSDRNQLFELKLSSGYIERKAMLAIGLSTTITNRGDSLTLHSKVGELYLGTSYLEQTEIKAGAKDNEIYLQSNFRNPVDDASADISTQMRLNRDSRGERSLHATLLPSSIRRDGAQWDMRAHAIDVRGGVVDIDNFTVESRGQRLLVDGELSRSTADTVKMEMQNFDLSVLSSLISRIGYNINGRTSGDIVASSALDNARIKANVNLDDVVVNKVESPPLSLSMTWDQMQNRASVYLSNRLNRDTVIRGYYVPSSVRYYAKCEVDELNLALLDPPLGGVVTETEGRASVNLTLEGQRREAKLTGEVKVSGASTKIAYTGVRYWLPSATINVSDNLISCPKTTVEDIYGNTADMSLSVNLQHLSNISYAIRLLPQELMVLDTEEEDNDLFYGKVFASGMANITGDKRGVNMNITATSAGSSHFYMPISSKTTISEADFISFVQPQTLQRVDSLDRIAIRRKNFEQKNVKSAAGGSMVINMALDVQPNTEVQLVIDPTVGDIIKARGEGKLNISLEPKANRFEIYGDYEISEGNYLFTLQNIVNKRFVINPGSTIQWTGDPLDAKLNIDAIYKLKASLQPVLSDESTRTVPVDCVITLTESLTQPEVSFAIELPSSDAETQAMFNNILNDQESISRQFFYLMLANSFIAETSGSSDLGASAGAATGFELLTNQLSNWLSTSNYNVIIRYRPESEISSEEFDFGFSKGLINNRLLVELEGNYVMDNETTTLSENNNSNFMGEAYITWLIDPAGGLRLKGFTQTIDRYDENQGLQETGVGIYYRESFNNFADLRERVRNRFSASPERLEKRERRRKKRADAKSSASEMKKGDEEVAIKEEEEREIEREIK